MSIFDYHRRSLCGEIWDLNELTLKHAARTQVARQVASRFPHATRIFLVGDLTGHYYNDQSELDVAVQATEGDFSKYQEEANIASGYFIPGTIRRVSFHVLKAGTAADALASQFGTVFDLKSGVWYGKRVSDTSEMARPEAVLSHVHWRLFKAKSSTELYPYTWRVLREAFTLLPDDSRKKIVYTLTTKAQTLSDEIRDIIKKYNSARVWRVASEFIEELEDDDTPDLVDEYVVGQLLPLPVVKAIVNKFRYEDVVNVLDEMNDRLEEDQMKMIRETAPILHLSSADTDSLTYDGFIYKEAGPASINFLWDRLINLVDLIVIHSGGYGSSLDTLFSVFDYVLEHSRYATTGARRRRVVMRLYRKYFRHVDEERKLT